MACGSSHGLRSSSAAIMSAVRWSGRTPASAPLILPIGVLQASTANTADIGHLPRWALASPYRQARGRYMPELPELTSRRMPVSQAPVDGVDERAIARVLPARTHLPGHVRDGQAGLRVAEAERATRPEVAERGRAPAHRPLWLSQLEADPEPGPAVQDSVLAVDLLGD